MKKLTMFALLLTCVFSLTACGSNTHSETSELSPTSATPENTTAISDITSAIEEVIPYAHPKIDDIEWVFSNGVSYQEPVAFFGYTNNTGFTITKLLLNFKLSEDIAPEQLSIFADLKEDFSLSDEDLSEITPYIYDHMVCDDGETVNGAVCYLMASFEASDSAQCELLILDSAEITYIGTDGKQYEVSYSAANNGYSDIRNSEELYTWSESTYAKLLPCPETRIATVDYDNPDCFQFTAYDIDSNGYADYIEACKEAGFSNDIEESSLSFWGTNSTGHRINIRFFPTMNAIELVLKPE